MKAKHPDVEVPKKEMWIVPEETVQVVVTLELWVGSATAAYAANAGSARNAQDASSKNQQIRATMVAEWVQFSRIKTPEDEMNDESMFK